MKLYIVAIMVSLLTLSCGAPSVIVKETINPAGTESVVVPPLTSSTVVTTEIRYDIRCKELKLGAALPLSGDMKSYGNKARKGIDLAVNNFNNTNKSNISVDYCDTDNTSSLELLSPSGEVTPESPARLFFENFKADRLAIGVIGPMLSKDLSLFRDLAEKQNVPVVSPSALSLEKVQPSEYFYTDAVYPHDDGRTMAEFAVNTLKKKKLAVIYPHNSAYGTAAAMAFKEEAMRLGAEVTSEVIFEEGSYDFKDQMVNLGGIDPHITKNIMAADKSNLESVVVKLVSQLRALMPAGTEKKRTSIVLMSFVNGGRENEKLSDDFDFGRIISEKLSFGLGKYKDTKIPKFAELKSFIERYGSDRSALVNGFNADVILTGVVREKNPLSYTCKVTVDVVAEKNAQPVEVEFGFTVSDKLITNPRELDAIYISANAYDSESLISHLVFYELKVPYMGTVKLNDKNFLAGQKLSDVELYYTAEFFVKSILPDVSGFVQMYKEAYFEEPDYFSASAFDAANILLHAIGKGACSKVEVRNSIRNISSMDLVTGDLTYDGTAFKKDLHILGIRDRESLEFK